MKGIGHTMATTMRSDVISTKIFKSSPTRDPSNQLEKLMKSHENFQKKNSAAMSTLQNPNNSGSERSSMAASQFGVTNSGKTPTRKTWKLKEMG